MMKRFLKIGLMKRNMMIVAFVLVISLTIVGVMSYVVSTKQVMRLIMNDVKDTAQSNVDIIGLKLLDVSNITKQIGQESLFSDALSQTDTQVSKASLKKTITKFQEMYTNQIEMLVLVDINGNGLVNSFDDQEMANISDRSYFSELKNTGKQVMSDVVISRISGIPVVVVAQPIEKNGIVIGALLATVRFDALVEGVDQIQISNKGYAYMCNKEGLIIRHPNKEMVFDKNINDLQITELTELFKQAQLGKTVEGYYTYNHVYKYVYIIPTGNWMLAVTADYKDIMEPVVMLRNRIILISIMTLICALGLSAFITKYVTINPILRLRKAMVLAGEGDLTQRVRIRSKDEVEELGNTFNAMMDLQSNIVKKIRESSEVLQSAAEELTASSEEVNASTEEISSNIQTIAAAAVEQKDVSSSALKAFMDLEKYIVDSEIKVNETLTTGERSLKMTETGRSQMTDSVLVMERIAQSISSAVNSLEELHGVARDVESISGTINTIAGNINLLALNASIEAARAGESGKGFSVVAEEVRKLAEQTTIESKKVNSQIERMSNKINALNIAIASTEEKVVEGVGKVKSVDTTFTGLVEAISESAEYIRNIHDNLQNEKAQSIIMNAVIINVSKGCEHTAASSEGISAAVQEQTAMTETLVTTAEETSNMSEELFDLVSMFKI